MKAVFIKNATDQDNLEIREVDPPQLGPEEVRIRVHSSGLNRADLLQRRGLHAPPPGVTENIPGLECAGEVIATGEAVSRFRKGDRVMALTVGAAQAEEVVSHQGLICPVPEKMSLVEAAAVPEAFITAYDALILQGEFALGQTALIHAVGSGVGTAALQLAIAAGAAQIYGTASAEKLEKAGALGLKCGIDYHGGDFADTVLSGTPNGVDVILDFVGGSYWESNLKCLISRGRLIVIGLLGSSKFPEHARLTGLLLKRAHVIGTALRLRPHYEKVDLVAKFAARVLPLLAQGRLNAVVDREYAAKDAIEAYRYLQENRNFGKVVLRWLE